MKITDGGLDDSRVRALLAHHSETARAAAAPVSAHTLDLNGLMSPDIRFWTAWDGDPVIAVGALKRLSRLNINSSFPPPLPLRYLRAENLKRHSAYALT